MWFRVSIEGHREFAHHTDPNQISPSYRGRTRYTGGSYSSCSVQIRGVKLGDAGQYHFRFETDQPLGRWTSPDTITLDVTARLSCQNIKDSQNGQQGFWCLAGDEILIIQEPKQSTRINS
ncbi:sialoadhesin-like isoform X1 [Gambusia affinis]|uniref:sialoadhesin-like isoform X1 n=1 Tax=Gambusia affinis TaxID=33528 RepID=UPI001CDC4B03|nr:sialoadhesin-like isoform X1 [Gambusia affinis]